jgi:hypothetical protein
MANLVLNGRSIDTIDEIAENFVEEDVLREFKSGSLSAWLEEYGYDDELERVKNIKPTAINARIVPSIADALNLDDDVIAENAARREEQQRKERKAQEEKRREESESQTVRLLPEKDDRNVDTHDKVQLWEGGPYWATMNIGAEKPEDYGYYFWWGDTVGYKQENNKWVASDGSNLNFSFTESNTPTYYMSTQTMQSEGWIISKDGTYIESNTPIYYSSTQTMQSKGWFISKDGAYVLAPEHDAAQKHWGGDWRMPTQQELDDLNSKCDWTWGSLNGVNGCKVRGIGDYASNSIFLPCAGYVYGPTRCCAGLQGHYWSSELSGFHYAQNLDIDSNSHYTYNRYRDCGQSVRPVQGKS